MNGMAEEIRVQFGEMDRKRDEGLTTPSDILRFNDISYGSDFVWNKLDVYYKKGTSENLPVIVSVHGGGWVYGDKDVYQYYTMHLAQMGFTVVNFSYRLPQRLPGYRRAIPAGAGAPLSGRFGGCKLRILMDGAAG